MKRIDFAMVGGGWRADFYLRVAQALPERFSCSGVVVRDSGKRRAFAERWQVPVFADIAGLLAGGEPQFTVTSVSWDANPAVIGELVRAGMPVLSETPPAPDLPGLIALHQLVDELDGRVQVAEQYHLQPHHAARIAICRDRLIGTPTYAQVSAAHGYHGISLIRRLLGVGLAPCTVAASSFSAPLVAGPDRSGPPSAEQVRDSTQQFFWFDYGDRLALFDFTGDQYFSWIRANRVLVRGERGEIRDNHVSYLRDYQTPIHLSLCRHEAGREGNLEGLFLAGLQLGERMVYRNPLAPAALADDDIAVGACLLGMARSLESGDPLYSLAEACHDHYLYLLCQQALEQGQALASAPQPWTAPVS